MLIAQIRHPVTLATLLFLLGAGLAIRWNEYRLPRFAYRVDAMGIALTKSPPAIPLADAANGALLYEEAFHLLYPQMLEDPEFKEHEKDSPLAVISERCFGGSTPSRYGVLGNVPKSFSNETKPVLEAYLEQRRDVLALLYRAADIPGVSWSVWERPGVPQSRSWLWNPRIADLLLMDALLHVIDHNEAGVVRTVTSLDAFVRATEQLDPPISRGRDMLLSRSLRLMIGYGIESHVFSDRALDALDGLLSYKEDPAGRTLQQDRMWEGWNRFDWINWPHAVPWAGPFWYSLRYSSRNSMKEVMLYELLLNILPGAAFWEQNGHLAGTIQRVCEASFFVNSMGEAVDPYSSDKKFIYRYKCGYWELLKSLSRTWQGVQMRTALRVVIALEKCQRRTGAFPDGFDALTPADVSPDLLRMARNMIDYRRTQEGWELWGIREVPDLSRLHKPVLLYTYPMLTQEE